MGLGAVPPTNLKCVFVPLLTFQTRVHPRCTPRQELNSREENIPKEDGPGERLHGADRATVQILWKFTVVTHL